jgi:hypothetical protein
MVTNLKKVYDRLLAAGLKLKAKKCHLKKVVYLGQISQMLLELLLVQMA